METYLRQLTSKSRTSSGVNGRIALTVTFLIMISTMSFGARKFSQATGNWNTASTWVGGVPVANDTVYILKQHTVSVSANLYSNSTYMFVIVIGTLDLTNNGKLSFNTSSNVIVETGGRILGDGNSDQISIGGGGSEYTGSQGTITGKAYVSNNHTPTSGEGTAGCNCYNGTGASSCTITSTNGYTVHILVWVKKINVQSNPCNNGFQYGVTLDYSVQFTGGSPGSLWTLQGNLFCGAQQISFNLPTNGGTGTMTPPSNAYRSNTNCSPAPTPQSMGCLNASISIQGPGIASQTCTNSLPIELISFDASQCNNAVCLNWATASEQNFDKFIVEHSEDGRDYDSIGFVSATGNSKLQQDYKFQHLFASLGKNYYRLKSLDLDRSYEYSRVILTNFEGEKSIVVFPNPVIESSVQVFTNFTPAVGDRVEIFDNLGLKLMEYEISTPDSKLTFNWTLKHGSYLLRYVSGNYSKIIRFTSN